MRDRDKEIVILALLFSVLQNGMQMNWFRGSISSQSFHLRFLQDGCPRADEFQVPSQFSFAGK